MIEIRVVLKFGVELAKTAGLVQERVKDQIVKMTSNTVRQIDVIIDEVRLEENKDLDSIFKDIDLTLQSLNYPKKEIKNLFPKLINNIKNNKNSSLEKKSISFENLLKEAMNYLDKQ
mgnify:CR=1 FL=1